MTIGTGMIVKNEAAVIGQCLKSVGVFSDLICIVDTGSTDNTLEKIKEFATDQWTVLERTYEEAAEIKREYLKPKTIIWTQYLGASEKDDKGDWKLWNFGKARNAYVDLLDRMVDWIFWVDADDDVLDSAKVLALPFNDPNVLMYGFWVVNDRVAPTRKWMHHRLWKTGLGNRYSGACHEYPSFDPVKQKDAGINVYHSHNGDGKECGNERNLRILQREYNGGDRSTRTLFYLANTMRDCKQYVEAIAVYEEYLKLSKLFHDEILFAHLYRARCYRLTGNFKKAISCAFEGLAHDDRFAELWMELSYNYWFVQDWKKSNATALGAFGPMTETVLFREDDKYSNEPIRMLSSR